MAFGQQSGPPASGRQLQRLLGLLQDAGYSGFRDARGPLGFTQRQGGGKFTVAEADAFIEQLEAEAEAALAEGGGTDGPPEIADDPDAARSSAAPKRRATDAAPSPAGSAAARREARLLATLREMPAALLARDLERRGWIVIPPEGLTTAEEPTAP